MSINDLRLRDLPLGARLGFTCIVATIGGGLVMSATHMMWHHGNRDERPGLTLDDVRSQYHGLDATAPLLVMIEKGHPANLAPAAKEPLIKWLKSTRVAEDYDNIDMGDNSPAELIAKNCLSCHSRKAPDAQAAAKKLPLDTWQDVKLVAFTRKINKTGDNVIAASLHTHALGLGSLAAVTAMLAVCTNWNRKLISSLVFVACAGLLVDLVCQWFAKGSMSLVYGIVGGGAAYAGATGMMLICIFAELWRPVKRA